MLPFPAPLSQEANEDLRLGYDLCKIMNEPVSEEVELIKDAPGCNGALNYLYASIRSANDIWISLHAACRLGAYLALSCRDAQNLLKNEARSDSDTR